MENGEPVVLDTKLMHPAVLHKLIKEGGSLKFQNFPFAIQIIGTGSSRVEVNLLAIPTGSAFKPHMNPFAKKEKIDISSADEGVLEM